ncbi:MAG TPA: AbrB/MazE/SpoVT family DNA-binding domain-containing protein [Chloroflexota bacterium]|nr:AbrB/MazE/SpoVT family DNA-binding domain-containing protein [Chloroflexota bacterium]HUM72042.1 AbrB/MazE/SpoVT family DNA-binding domain-containing protein [Chloroflexota bacterium]
MLEAKLIKIGNSQGIRLPKRIISKYGLGNAVLLEETENGVLILAAKSEKLSWEDTYKAMANAEQGEWTDWQNMDAAEETHL